MAVVWLLVTACTIVLFIEPTYGIITSPWEVEWPNLPPWEGIWKPTRTYKDNMSNLDQYITDYKIWKHKFEYDLAEFRLKMKGPEDCELADRNFKNDSMYPDSEFTYDYVLYKGIYVVPNISVKHVTYICSDPTQYKDEFYKLVTIAKKKAPDGTLIKGPAETWTYCDKKMKEFEWVPSKETVKKSRERRHKRHQNEVPQLTGGKDVIPKPKIPQAAENPKTSVRPKKQR